MEPLATTGRSERLTLHTTTDPRDTVIQVIGELDHDTAPLLLESLKQALTGHTGVIVVDCAGIAFCDSSGLNVLLQGRRTAATQGRALVVAAPSRATTRLLRITGADAALEVFPSVEEARTN